MTRNFLEGLGISKENIDKIMAEHGKNIESEKAKTTVKAAELEKANETIKGLQADIAKFDGVDVDALKKAATDWETKYNNDIKAEQKKAADIEKSYKLKEVLKSKGVKDADYFIYKQGGLDKLEQNAKGDFTNLESILKDYKESNPSQFEEVSDPGEGNKGGVSISFGTSSGAGGAGKNEGSNADMNAALRAGFGRE